MAKSPARAVGNYLVTVLQQPGVFFLGKEGKTEYDELLKFAYPYLKTGDMLKIEGDWWAPQQKLRVEKDHPNYGYLHKQGYRSHSTILNPVGRPPTVDGKPTGRGKPTNARSVLINWTKEGKR